MSKEGSIVSKVVMAVSLLVALDCSVGATTKSSKSVMGDSGFSSFLTGRTSVACRRQRVTYASHANAAGTHVSIRGGALSSEGSARPQVRADAWPQLSGRRRDRRRDRGRERLAHGLLRYRRARDAAHQEARPPRAQRGRRSPEPDERAARGVAVEAPRGDAARQARRGD